MPTQFTLSELLQQYLEADEQERHYHQIKEDIKAQLSALRDQNMIDDKVEAHGLQASYLQRKAWIYSPDVKALQQREQLSGAAQQQTTCYWAIRRSQAHA